MTVGGNQAAREFFNEYRMPANIDIKDKYNSKVQKPFSADSQFLGKGITTGRSPSSINRRLRRWRPERTGRRRPRSPSHLYRRPPPPPLQRSTLPFSPLTLLILHILIRFALSLSLSLCYSLRLRTSSEPFGRPRWQPDSEATMCNKCSVTFTFVVRKVLLSLSVTFLLSLFRIHFHRSSSLFFFLSFELPRFTSISSIHPVCLP